MIERKSYTPREGPLRLKLVHIRNHPRKVFTLPTLYNISKIYSIEEGASIPDTIGLGL